MLTLCTRPARCVSRPLTIWRTDNVRRIASAAVLHAKSSTSKSKLPSTPARTRFAPSPTGQLHLGSLRTALFNYLLARRTGGQFLLRLEDTDAKRTVPGAEQSLYADLRWAGLQWDEGPEIGGPYGPYRQSERTPIYRQHAAELLKTDHAYRCFCSADRLDALARQRRELGMPTDYDRTCAHLTESESTERAANGEAHVVRLRAPDTYPPFTDLVYGRIGGADTKGVTMKHGEIAYEDPILLKSDGTPTYHLANVIDDHLMEITHVVRATEWLPSTPKHLALYRAFGWEAPAYMHVGLLVDSEGRKLSKRTMSTSVHDIRDESHILAPALVNFAALLGWSHGRRSDVMQLDQLVDAFQAKFTRGNVTVSLEKLGFLQKAHAALTVQDAEGGKPEAHKDLREMLDALLLLVKDTTAYPGPSEKTAFSKPLREYVQSILAHDARNYETPQGFITRNSWFFRPITEAEADYQNPPPVEIATQDDIDFAGDLSTVVDAEFASMGREEWKHDKLEAAMKDATQRLASERTQQDETIMSKREPPMGTLHEMIIKLSSQEPDGGDAALLKIRQKVYYRLLCKYMRLALLNGNDGPGLGWTMEILGREVCLERIRQCGEKYRDHLHRDMRSVDGKDSNL
ncbi:hypothetical protein FH972_024424 [Carpinus fangiana]|uniref:glutamate--tRNA ligase n=1 Tax=Carpinus fangiana TaxID=176857 RepID=A0A5N6KYE8_9ROSI|nr:hypothetical protein FH972_024424 [Carpinus fangiana]